jgi:hypothetical protein
MEMIMEKNYFCELTEDEAILIDGGTDYFQAFCGGVLMIAGAAVAVGSCGTLSGIGGLAILAGLYVGAEATHHS